LFFGRKPLEEFKITVQECLLASEAQAKAAGSNPVIPTIPVVSQSPIYWDLKVLKKIQVDTPL
jgi:hypothetical protein